MPKFEIERIPSDVTKDPLAVEVESYLSKDPNSIVVIRFDKGLHQLTQGDLLSTGNALRGINKMSQKRVYFVTNDVDMVEMYGESATHLILEGKS